MILFLRLKLELYLIHFLYYLFYLKFHSHFLKNLNLKNSYKEMNVNYYLNLNYFDSENLKDLINLYLMVQN
jgi:hypothetical protein